MLQASCFLSRQLGVYLQSLGLQPFQLLLLIYSGQQCAKAGIQVLNCDEPNPMESRPRSESRMTFLRGNDEGSGNDEGGQNRKDGGNDEGGGNEKSAPWLGARE